MFYACFYKSVACVVVPSVEAIESQSLVLVINDTKLLMPCIKCFE
jgi:hypothetical protein